MSENDPTGSERAQTKLHRVTISDLYTEAGNNFRNYSQCSLNVRLATVAQGVVLLTGCGYTVVEDQKWFALILSVFGLLFTFMLFLLHSAYLKAADEMCRAAGKIELQSGFRGYGPFYRYRRIRRKRFGSFWVRMFTIHAAFFLISFSFSVCAIYALFMVPK